MASPSDRREGEETGKAEADVGEVKPGQMELFAAMLASMRQDLDQRADERAREQARRAEERADERAREQAQRAEERADEQARHLADVLQSCFSSLKVETQQYTDQGCDSARSERLEEVRTPEGEVRGLREAERQLREVAPSHAEEEGSVLAGSAGAAVLQGPIWGSWQGLLEPGSVVAEPIAAAGGWGAPASLPPSPPPSPPCQPARRSRSPLSLPWQQREVATWCGEEQEASRVLAAGARVADWRGSAWGPWQGPLKPGGVVAEPVEAAGGWGAVGAAPLGPAGAGVGPINSASLPLSPPPSPPCRPACSPRGPPAPFCSSSASPRSGRLKPAGHDGKLAWKAQFKMPAAAQGWGEDEKALLLTTALRGSVDEPGRLVGSAERTLGRPDMPAATRLQDAPQRLCGVTGHCVQSEGPVEARIGVGSAVERRPRDVADRDEPCVLGLDYLPQDEACADLGRELERLRGQAPLLPKVGCAEVVAAERLHLAPGTEARVLCCRSDAMPAEGTVESTEGLQLPGGVAAGGSLEGAGEESVTVLVANSSDEARKVPAGAKLGTCEEVEQLEEPSGSAESAAVRPLPNFLEDSAHRSAAHLTEAQTKVRHTLARYADVFSGGGLDLPGCTGLVKHNISTGNGAPTRSPPRHVVPARREELQRAVNELAAQGVMERTDSPWPSAVVLGMKKNGTQHFCADCRALRDKTGEDSHPLPWTDDALTRALEFEALTMTSGLEAAAPPCHDLRGRMAKVKMKAASIKASPEGFRGSCGGCGKRGHRCSRCLGERRTRSLDRPSPDAHQPRCKDCGQSGHRLSACPRPRDAARAGSADGLEKGVDFQPSPALGPA
ncbi:uncharacterized protein LOC127009845 isoform X2 [Eriocheir sinensis]|uniref:uncharacterized protein LOC127009845 isoform X2 n=1 Tax=Eriocheir sinensis TaxID=95602 RepID=UPI0021C97EDA|nr:uncharacterized protein LOC127009845 isoform X2 [Eriocheir sinensis]